MKKFDSPFLKKDAPVFFKYWKMFVKDIAKRINFQEGMLKNLEILCSLYQEYEELQAMIKEDGYTVKNTGRYGDQLKTHPAITQRNKVLSEIRQYSSALNLLPSSEKAKPEGKKDEWS